MKLRPLPQCCHDTRSFERGGVLVLLAFLLVPLILFVALAIDSTRLSTSHSQQRETGEFAALAAIEAFHLAEGTYEEKLEAAFVEAERVINRPENRLVARARDAEETVGVLMDPVGVLDNRSDETPETMGYLWPGSWWFSEPLGTSGGASCAEWHEALPDGPMDPKCPCPLEGTVPTWKGECFERNNASATNANAFEVTLTTQENSPLRTVFASVVGQTHVSISSRAWATKVPRRGVFLVDLSRSMQFETHVDVVPPVLRWETADPHATDYAFRLTGSCNDEDDYTNNCIGSYCEMFNPFHEVLWNVPLPIITTMDPARPANPLYPATKHFKDDYQCVMVDRDGDGDSDESYLIDTDGLLPGAATVAPRPHQLQSGGVYGGVEPLTTVISGVHRALEVIQERALAGDAIGVVFFDEDILEVRTFPAPGEGLLRPGTEAFDELLELTTVSPGEADYPERLERRLKAFLFPRIIDGVDPGGFPQGRFANTDVPRALALAIAMLDQANQQGAADSYIALVSDGLSNCSHNAPGGNNPNPYADHNNFIDYDPNERVITLTSAGGFRCENAFGNTIRQFNNHLVSLQESSAIVAGVPDGDPTYELPDGFRTVVERGFSVHVFLTGSKVRPNTMVRPNLAGDACISQTEAMTNGYAYAYGGPPLPHSSPTGNPGFDTEEPGNPVYDYLQATLNSPDGFYQYPNQALYNTLVVPTAGIWAPTRPPCDPLDWPTALPRPCSEGGLVDALNAYCAQTADDFVPQVDQGEVANPDRPVTDVPGIIENGALICDPYCRGTNESFGSNVEKIYETNPFVLVESRLRRSEL